MSNKVKSKTTSPIGDLAWMFIQGKGKEDLNGVLKFSGNVVLEGEVAEQYKAEIEAFWEENKPKGVSKAKSLGFYEEEVKTGEIDSKGNDIREKSGRTVFAFKTMTVFKDGKPKIVKTFNAKGTEVQLGNKTPGAGCRGRIQGLMDIYEVKATKQAGVSLYLDAVQFTVFKEHTGGSGFSAVDDEDADFESVDADGMGAITDNKPEGARPRL